MFYRSAAHSVSCFTFDSVTMVIPGNPIYLVFIASLIWYHFTISIPSETKHYVSLYKYLVKCALGGPNGAMTHLATPKALYCGHKPESQN